MCYTTADKMHTGILSLRIRLFASPSIWGADIHIHLKHWQTVNSWAARQAPQPTNQPTTSTLLRAGARSILFLCHSQVSPICQRKWHCSCPEFHSQEQAAPETLTKAGKTAQQQQQQQHCLTEGAPCGLAPRFVYFLSRFLKSALRIIAIKVRFFFKKNNIQTQPREPCSITAGWKQRPQPREPRMQRVASGTAAAATAAAQPWVPPRHPHRPRAAAAAPINQTGAPLPVSTQSYVKTIFVVAPTGRQMPKGGAPKQPPPPPRSSG